MKFVFYGVMVIAAYFIGKSSYGALSPVLLRLEPEAEVTDEERVINVKVRSPLGTVTEKVNLSTLKQEEFPEKIKLKEEVTLLNEQGEEPTVLGPGSPVKPLSLEGATLTVTSPLASHLTGTIKVRNTDFAEAVARQRMKVRLDAVESEIQPKKEEMAAKEMKEEEVAEVPEPVEEEEASVTVDADGIVAAMKASLEAKEIRHFTTEQVKSWEAGEEESIDGESYQIGVVSFEEETILGTQVSDAKALIKNGKIEKWIFPKTGIQIK